MATPGKPDEFNYGLCSATKAKALQIEVQQECNEKQYDKLKQLMSKNQHHLEDYVYTVKEKCDDIVVELSKVIDGLADALDTKIQTLHEESIAHQDEMLRLFFERLDELRSSVGTIPESRGRKSVVVASPDEKEVSVADMDKTKADHSTKVVTGTTIVVTGNGQPLPTMRPAMHKGLEEKEAKEAMAARRKCRDDNTILDFEDEGKPKKSRVAVGKDSPDDRKKENRLRTPSMDDLSVENNSCFHPPEPKGRLVRMARSMWFKIATVVLMVTNAAFVAVQTQHAADNLGMDLPPPEFMLIDLVYCIAFSVEILFRICGERSYFFCGPEKRWNLFDLGIVGLTVQDQVMVFFASAVTSAGNLTFLRALRVLRVLRVIRLFKFCPQVNAVLNGIIETMMSIAWLFVLLALLLYIFGLMFMSVVTNYLQSTDLETEMRGDLEDWFGSVLSSFLTLFKATTGGIEWTKVGDALLEMSLPYGALFISFVAFFFFGVVNVATSVFVESARTNSERARLDGAATRVDSVEKAIRAFDPDNLGKIRLDEFTALCMQPNAAMQSLLQTLEISPDEAVHFFEVLDTSSHEQVDIKLLVKMLRRLLGQARSTDLNVLVLEHRRLARDFHEFCRYVERNFEELLS